MGLRPNGSVLFGRSGTDGVRWKRKEGVDGGDTEQ